MVDNPNSYRTVTLHLRNSMLVFTAGLRSTDAITIKG